MKFVSFCLFVLLTSSATSAIASVDTTFAFEAAVTMSAPPVTGKFSDLESPAWRAGTKVTDLVDYTDRKIAAERTDAFLVFAKDAVYCAVVSYQESPVTATQSVNNVGLGLDDYVSLMFDTSGNGTNQYFFETSPRGVRYQAASESSRYDPSWTAFAQIGKGRWLGEIIVPYRFLRGSSRSWRVNVVRYFARSQQYDTWAYNARMDSPFDETFWPTARSVPIIDSKTPKPTAQVFALGSFGRDRRIFEGAAGSFLATTPRYAGVDVKVPITSSLEFAGTLNPDFSNVENDQQVISPQEFRYQYSEYRPFFTQGANYLPGNEIFYSPSIAIFDHGEKLEGQIENVGVGLLNVGAFGAEDRAYDASYNSPNQELSFALGGAQAQRSDGTDNVSELSVSSLNLTSRLSFGASAASEYGSFTSEPASRYVLYGGITKPNYSVQGAYYDIGPGYHPLDAYVARADIRGPQVSGSLASTTDTKRLIRGLAISAYADRYADRSGATGEADSGFNSSLTLHNLLAFSVGQSISSLRDYSVAYPTYISGNTVGFDQTYASLSYRAGTSNTESVSYSWGPYPGYYLQQLNASLTRQIYSRLNAEADFGQVLERRELGAADGQLLARLSFFAAISSDSSGSVAYRLIRGNGGFAFPGANLAFGYVRRFSTGSTLQAEIGSPASTQSLDRYVLKYVLQVGRGSGE